jgi:hypothetical protein
MQVEQVDTKVQDPFAAAAAAAERQALVVQARQEWLQVEKTSDEGGSKDKQEMGW